MSPGSSEPPSAWSPRSTTSAVTRLRCASPRARCEQVGEVIGVGAEDIARAPCYRTQSRSRGRTLVSAARCTGNGRWWIPPTAPDARHFLGYRRADGRAATRKLRRGTADSSMLGGEGGPIWSRRPQHQARRLPGGTASSRDSRTWAVEWPRAPRATTSCGARGAVMRARETSSRS